MLFPPGQIDTKCFDLNLPVWYLGATLDASETESTLIGVNSGHMCSDGTARSRGLWVDPNHRGRGVGVALLLATILAASKYRPSFVWSFPRKTSLKSYSNAGYFTVGDEQPSETSDANFWARTAHFSLPDQQLAKVLDAYVDCFNTIPNVTLDL